MPIYEYRCTKGHNFDELQRMTDDPLTSCTVCGAPVQRVFHPVAVHFKGSGFYSTDYGKKKGAAAGNSDSSGKESGSGKDSSKGSESKKDTSKSSTATTGSSKPASSD